MEVMQINITLDKIDWNKLQNHISKELPKQKKSFFDSFWKSMILWFLLVGVFMSLFHYVRPIHWPTAILTGTIFICVYVVLIFNMIKLRKLFEPSDTGIFCGEHEFVFDDEGITIKGAGYTEKHNWSTVKKIERTSDIILIYLDTTFAYVFPEKKLNNPSDFYKTITELYSNNKMKNSP
jgi:hypothetical protein